MPSTTGYGYGLAGAIAIGTAQQSHDRCVEDMRKIGYVKIPDGIVGISLENGTKPPLIKAVADPVRTAGVRQGDALLTLDGQAVENMYDTLKILSVKKIGDTVTVKVQRSQEVLESS